MSSLRSKVIRLAHEQPSLRPHLLPLLKTASGFDPSHYGLEGLLTGRPVTLYHGTTATFTRFDLSKSRDELVEQFYGKGIFLTPSKRVAWKYANANRNMGLPVDVIADLKQVNRPAGEFLEAVYREGAAGWESFARSKGLWDDATGHIDFDGLRKLLKSDPNTVSDIADHIPGAKKTAPTDDVSGELMDLFHGSTGSPEWMYDLLDEVGLKGEHYRPKVYKVQATATNTLVTASKSEARKARSQGYDAVIFHGADLVDGVPEVALFDPNHAKVLGYEV